MKIRASIARKRIRPPSVTAFNLQVQEHGYKMTEIKPFTVYHIAYMIY